MASMNLSVRRATCAVLLACGVAAASLSPALAASRTTTVTLKNIAFHRAVVTVHRGDRVRWVWKDGDLDTPHNVTFAHRHSRTQQNGTYTLTFPPAGPFRYHCTIHPGMDGRVVVR